VIQEVLRRHVSSRGTLPRWQERKQQRAAVLGAGQALPKTAEPVPQVPRRVYRLRASKAKPALFTKASTATAERDGNIHHGSFLRAKIMPMALDLASAVTTRLMAGGLAARLA